MNDPGLDRTYYGNLTTNIVRSGSTGHGEALLDMDGYLPALEGARNSALFDWVSPRGLPFAP
jgi:hypothetical protein